MSEKIKILAAENKFLKLISGGEELVLDETKRTTVWVYEMGEKDATFAQMFGSLSNDLNKLCLTYAHIKNFVKKYRNWLRIDGYGTFFLFKVGDKFFVVSVSINSAGLVVRVHRFESSAWWSGGGRRRLVVPQLT